ncbi:helix-turn-helix domain-containing protein [Sulfitobacter sp. W002]|uniref:helix-turn-helix domain-containing protein n=1 Tax=Sulfitobacter sp. W002 TaxID=2867024 RepID=UPI0021A567CD|nr:helix-turn-helix transcriptional regulator [Sulfitobacter sp. W002]UWR31359.1 helix-turn-helix domain-containing protein [Sulfitobacter sp. W002]
MDDKWFKQQQKRVGATAEDIAQKMGRTRANVSNIYTGRQKMSLEWARAFAEVLQVPIDEVLKRAGVLKPVEARRVTPEFADSDAAPWGDKSNSRDGVYNIAAALGGARPGVDVWQIERGALSLMGYFPGDMILLDTHQSELCKAGDVVIAQKYDGKTGASRMLLRRYEPPVLVAASPEAADRRVDVVDGSNVLIRGKIIGSWRVV